MLLLLINIAESDKVGITDSSVDDGKDKMIKKLPFKNLNKAEQYFTLEARLAFIQLKKAFTEAFIF